MKGLNPMSDGFVIITAASDQGVADIHDRKPLVLAPEHAKERIAPDTSPVSAAEIAVDQCRPAGEFGTRSPRMWTICVIGVALDQSAYAIA
jgi:putative SOS response-associated peptidase YedK